MRKLGVVGVPGKMALRVVARCRELALREAFARKESAAVGKDVGLLAGIDAAQLAVAPFDDTRFKNADVWIEFALPSVTPRTLQAARAAGKALLVCTTGLSQDTLTALHDAARDIPVMLAPNTSLGVAALNAALRIALQALGPAYQAEIVEIHHDQKKDAPSGTAMRLVDTIRHSRGTPREKIVTGRTGERTRDEIGVFGVRGGNVIGEHTVYLFGESDRLELTHRAHSRDLFADGALRAAAWLVEQPAGWYTIENCLGLESA